MKRITISICSAAILLACNSNKDSGTALVKSETTTATEAAMPDSATMMKNWELYMTPGTLHQMMATWDGEWTGDITLWMAPDAPPTKSTAISINKMAMGGRYQLSTTKGSFGGMPFEGMSTLAFDNHKKKFISTWIDNMGTGVMMLEGPWDERSKTITLNGKVVDPSTGKEMDVRETFTIGDNDHQVMKMYHKGADGKEYQSMEIKYSRKG